MDGSRAAKLSDAKAIYMTGTANITHQMELALPMDNSNHSSCCLCNVLLG